MQQKEGFPRARARGLQQVFSISILLLLLPACNGIERLPSDAMQPDLTMWSKSETPLLAATWPPTADTVWVRYTFAYGTNPAQLMDGSYVTRPLAKTVWKNGAATTEVLSNDMTRAAIQGIVPLDEPARRILDTEPQVSVFCLALTGLPDPNAPETKEMRAYYQAWFRYNGAFLALVRADHKDFVDWVESNQ